MHTFCRMKQARAPMVAVRMQGLPEVGTVRCDDRMDDGTPIKLAITIDRKSRSAVFDFDGTGPQVIGNTNAPPAVTTSAVIYSLRCLVKQDIPLNGGCLAPVTIKVRRAGCTPCRVHPATWRQQHVAATLNNVPAASGEDPIRSDLLSLNAHGLACRYRPARC